MRGQAVSSYAGRRAGGRRRRRGLGWLIALVVIIVLLVAADFIARGVAENLAASQFQKQGKLTNKPDVTIEGFPFLTQVASKNFSDVKVKAANEKEGKVTITSINATARAVHINSFSFNSGTIGRINGTLLIDFASLGDTLTAEIGALGTLLHGAGLGLSAAGPDQVKASLNLVVTTGSATWRISRVSPTELNVRLVASSGISSSLLGSIQNVNIPIPKLPLGLTIDSVRVTPAGVVGTISASNVPFGS
jgi:hypothetical protein